MKSIRLILAAVIAALTIVTVKPAQAFDPPATDYVWQKGNAPTPMNWAGTSFCVFHEIIGSFTSTHDWVQIDEAPSGFWEVYGGGNIQWIRATCVNSLAAEVQNGVLVYALQSSLPIPTTHTLPGTLQFQNLPHADFCFLQEVSGAMGIGVDGFGSHVDVYQTSPGQWLEDAEGDITQVGVEVGCVNMIFPDPAEGTAQSFSSAGGTNNFGPPGVTPNMPSYPQNLCGLTTVQGTWSSTQSFGQIIVNASRGTTTEQTSSTLFGDASIAANCLFLTPIQ